MKQIDGKAHSIREILQGQRYSVDYYQREYRWQKKQVEELVDDLAAQFLQDYDASDERDRVQEFGHYFLGSIILSQKDGGTFIVDGQQRLTTLTLILVHLHLRQGNREDRVKLEDLIYAEKYGKKKFNISVPERDAVMEALFKGQAHDTVDASESVQNLLDRYQELEGLFPEEIDDHALPYFCDWLIENVHLVAISATTDEDAYTIFETMNDRGLSLTPLDMLKGYLLASITDSQKRALAAQTWKKQVEALRKLGKEEDSDAVKAWLRARYAQSVRERKKGSENQDFERIGTEFHRWVKNHEEALGLKESDDFFRFVHQEMPFYTRHYLHLREASLKPVEGLEPVYHVACFRFTLQYPVILAALNPQDSEDTARRKIRMVATFLDILLARRAVNYLSMNFAALSYAMFLVIKELRGKDLAGLSRFLLAKLADQKLDLNGTEDGSRAGFSDFRLNHWSKGYIKTLLARMTVFLEEESDLKSHSLSAFFAGGKARFEIEHIWSNHPEQHQDEFPTAAEFAAARNLMGGLLLLHKKVNASYGDKPYTEKLSHYHGQNLLARSLHPTCYQNNPGFLQFVQRSGLPFKPHDTFKKADLEARHKLYHQLAERIWNPARIAQEVGA